MENSLPQSFFLSECRRLVSLALYTASEFHHSFRLMLLPLLLISPQLTSTTTTASSTYHSRTHLNAFIIIIEYLAEEENSVCALISVLGQGSETNLRADLLDDAPAQRSAAAIDATEGSLNSARSFAKRDGVLIGCRRLLSF